MRAHSVDAKRRSDLRGVELGEASARSRSEVVQAAAGANARSDRLDGGRDALEVRRDRLDRAPILGVHELDHVLRAHRVEPVGLRVDVLAHGRITSAAATAHTRAAPLVAM